MVRIREFSLERDYASVIALWQASSPGVRVGRSDTRAALALKLTRDPDLFLVAEGEGGLVGAVLGGFDGRRGMVYHLAVAAELQGRGVGQALMTELENRLRARGCVKAYLLVVPDNTAALDFYHHLGWDLMPIYLLGKDLDTQPRDPS
jgi:ribosomal protein S18 acetylase RimI-like enzyme